MTILITGATAGIGEATAKAFAAEGHRLIITGRRKERLEQLANSLTVDVLCLAFDVREVDAVKQAIASIPADWREIDVLVNNAGLAVGKDAIQNGVLDDWERMIDTNVKGFLYVTKEVSPLMIARNHGHIINIGSIAGREVYPNGNVYCATKHAVHALSQGMRLDMLKHGIRVTQIAPGLVETEFSVVRFKGDQQKADDTYTNMQPLTAEDIANIIVFAANQPPHVNINDILITPTAQANSVTVYRGKY